MPALPLLVLLVLASAAVWPLCRWALRRGGSPVGTGIVFSAVGFGWLFFVEHAVRCVLDRAAGEATVFRRGVLRARVERHRLEDVVDVVVQRRTGTSHRGGKAGFSAYGIALVLRSGEKVPLGFFAVGGHTDVRAAAMRLKGFVAGEENSALGPEVDVAF